MQIVDETPPDAAEEAILRAQLRAGGLRPKKSWGQNFCRDGALLRRMAALPQLPPGQGVVELGAGLGALTQALLAQGGPVLAVERDRELIPLLRARFADVPGLTLCEADAVGLDYAALAAAQGGPLTIVGNLPYQLSSRILVTLADAGAAVAQVVVLLQREVGERLAAGPGSRTYGLLSVLVQRRFSVRLVERVRPGAFVPPPRVESVVVHLRARPPVAEGVADAQLVAAARAAFSSRRKTLRNALASGCRIPAAAAAAAIERASLVPGARAETLSLTDFAQLGAALAGADLLPTHP